MAKKAKQPEVIDLERDVCTRVLVLSNLTGRAFFIYFYGLTENDLYITPNPYITKAMQRRGLKQGDYSTSVFWVEGVRPRGDNPMMHQALGELDA